MHDSRVRPAAAVLASAVRAGTIASRKGSATVAPMPRRTVRRERCFLVRYMLISPAHLECWTLDDPQDEGREAITRSGRVAHDPADGRHVEGRETSAETVGHEVLGERAHDDLPVLQERRAERDRAIE